MKKINKLFYIIILSVLFVFPVKAKNILQIGVSNAKVTVKVFSSLTCPHCANFHLNIFENLKKDFIDKNLVKFEHHSFPLDLAALNAELIVRCHGDSKKSFQLLGEIYAKQNNWAVGSDINVINESLKKIGLESDLSKSSMNSCLENETLQQQILNERINAQKNYQISSTPTIYINKKKYDGKHDYKKLKKAIEKLL
ncbi:DsbA family protein [Candidatus Pelagibacter bacterium]|nr:DsbA family protein [Candidatus Pelagibacter bacterium]|tara:strand:+ start:198 stop:788 length:591 start_codon:yes stop_codon:yes gene_type:complete